MAQQGRGGKKERRGKAKRDGKGKPLSLYVRDKISFETYRKMTGQKV